MRWDAGSGKTQPVIDIYRKSGYRAALALFPAIEDTDDDRGSLVESARCMAFAGNLEGALDYLGRARAAREGWMIFAAKDPAFAALRSDARFQKLTQLDQQ
jgi:hypothetical protein